MLSELRYVMICPTTIKALSQVLSPLSLYWDKMSSSQPYEQEFEEQNKLGWEMILVLDYITGHQVK